MAEKLKSPGSQTNENIQPPLTIKSSDLGRSVYEGIAERGEVGKIATIKDMADYERQLGGPVNGYYSYHAVEAFFKNGGTGIKFLRTAHYLAGVSQAVKATKTVKGYNALEEDRAEVDTLKIDAYFEGTEGDSITLNSLKKESVLNVELTAGAITGLTFVSTAGFEVGDVIEVKNVGGNYFRSVITEITSSTVVKIASVTIANTYAITTTTIKTASTHRAKSTMTADYSSGVDKMVLSNITGFKVGSILTIGDPANNKMEVKKIIRIDSNEVQFETVTINAYATADNVLIISQEFNLSVFYAQVERGPYNYLSMESSNEADYIENKINVDANYFIAVDDLDGAEDNLGDIPVVFEDVKLSGGNNGLSGLTDTDFVGSEAYGNGFYAMAAIQNGFYQLKCVDNLSKTVQQALYDYAESRNWWAVGNIQLGKTPDEAVDFVVNDAILNTSYGEIQYPNIKKINSLTNATILVPAAGHVAGLNARVWKDISKGPHIQPAGTEDGKLKDIEDLENSETDNKDIRDILDPNRINSLYRFPPWGILQYGINTLDASEALSQKGERIVFMFAEHSIEEGTPWAVFKNIDEVMKGRLRRSITSFLGGLRLKGALKGLTNSEAFVIDLESKNTETTEAKGEFTTRIGLATKKAGEFIYFEFTKKINEA